MLMANTYACIFDNKISWLGLPSYYHYFIFCHYEHYVTRQYQIQYIEIFLSFSLSIDLAVIHQSH